MCKPGRQLFLNVMVASRVATLVLSAILSEGTWVPRHPSVQDTDSGRLVTGEGVPTPVARQGDVERRD
jgi:hypothetical protein